MWCDWTQVPRKCVHLYVCVLCRVRLWALTPTVWVTKFHNFNCVWQWYSLFWTSLGFHGEFFGVPQANSINNEIRKHNFYIFSYIFFLFPVFVNKGMWLFSVWIFNSTVLCFITVCFISLNKVCFKSFFFQFFHLNVHLYLTGGMWEWEFRVCCS